MKVGLISGTVPLDVEIKEEKNVNTPYGKPSSPLRYFQFNGIDYVHIKRHGDDHKTPPHMVSHKANLYALKKEGVERVIGIGSSGIINEDIQAGSLVVCSDFISLFGRPTFYDGCVVDGLDYSDGVVHVSLSEPFCKEFRGQVIENLKRLKIRYSEGVVAQTRGPSLESSAEIRVLKILGGDLVNMTVASEAILARELGICYAGICTGDNLAAGIGEKLTFKEIVKNAAESGKQVGKFLEGFSLGSKNCDCSEAPKLGKF
jgi:5'-methylthioadenosine phosphorylase